MSLFSLAQLITVYVQ